MFDGCLGVSAKLRENIKKIVDTSVIVFSNQVFGDALVLNIFRTTKPMTRVVDCTYLLTFYLSGLAILSHLSFYTRLRLGKEH